MKRENQEQKGQRTQQLFIQELAHIAGKKSAASKVDAAGPFTTLALREESGA
jgi:hypothetical protein